ncbi:low affinity immunoglobulin epsilon Fc receptor [Alligator mississippiensis]|uniref:low affinity immunoglobulin epsilon Fc receptor n=1 Tax=Alligator mississippiensis TaxID=8496 RepID=UPI0006EC8004|nr:low affinity immunoglobulin epsilon Fc receptor [Alligator mississippiensis]KYO37562.1 low affinity immunoglobulin epsilon Fc receptor-like [Alligator mississippiensis]
MEQLGYNKQENSDCMELEMKEPSRKRGCRFFYSAQRNTTEILCALLLICFVIFTAVIIANQGKTSRELSDVRLKIEKIPVNSTKDLSDFLYSIGMSKELKTINSQLLHVSKEVDNTKLKLREIQADSKKDLQNYTDIKSLTHSMFRELTEELTEVKRACNGFQNILSSIQEEIRNLSDAICTGCPQGWLPFQKTCYYFSTSTKSWTNAKEFCIDQGSHLVIVNTEHENRFLSNYILDSRAYWLGLTDTEKEGDWQWLDGTSLSLRFWNTGEPNNVGQQGEDCGSMISQGKWNDAVCSVANYWICEQKR